MGKNKLRSKGMPIERSGKRPKISQRGGENVPLNFSAHTAGAARGSLHYIVCATAVDHNTCSTHRVIASHTWSGSGVGSSTCSIGASYVRVDGRDLPIHIDENIHVVGREFETLSGDGSRQFYDASCEVVEIRLVATWCFDGIRDWLYSPPKQTNKQRQTR
jgi:hypothetical protein